MGKTPENLILVMPDSLNRLLYNVILLIGLSLPFSGCHHLNEPASVESGTDTKPILLVTTDIGGDPDDQQSMRRLLLFANEFDIRGLVASSSGTPGEVEGGNPQPELIQEIIDDYEEVLPNLRKNASGYPDASKLRLLVAAGDSNRLVESIKAGNSSAGSRLIVRVVDEATGPVNISIWGGARDVAQALVDVRETRSEAELAKFIGKLRVYATGDQDGYNKIIDGKKVDSEGSGKWIKDNFPNLLYLETNPPERNRFASLFRGMYQNDSKGGDYPETPLVREGVELLNGEAWLRENVIENHGALGSGYPVVRQNPRSARNQPGVKEGDTPSWFYFLQIGLSDPDYPEWGGWGGRLEPSEGNHYIDTQDDHWYADANDATRVKWTVARWREAYQNEFAARMDWCVDGPDLTNHAPSITLNGDVSKSPVFVSLEAGESLSFPVRATDPDGGEVSLSWWVYADVTSVDPSDLVLGDGSEGLLDVHAKGSATGKQYHVIVEAVDSGSPQLTRYRRLVVEVVPPRELEADLNNIMPYRQNPRFWQYKGEPVMLLGGSKDDNLFQLPDLEEHLDEIVEAGGNYIRNTMSDRDREEGNVSAFAKTRENLYDLEKWNEEYWKRMSRFLELTEERGVVVQIEIWDRFDHSRSRWADDPFNPKNNLNYSYAESGFSEEYPEHPGKNLQPFFFTTPLQDDNQTVLKYQQAFVRKLLSYTLKYGNVIYCMDNETSGEVAWSTYWADFVTKIASSEGKKIYTTEMWDDHDLRSSEHLSTFAFPDRYQFVDISQANHQVGDFHWESILYVRDYLSGSPRPMNMVKIYGSKSSQFGNTDREGVDRFWRSLLGGVASARFHRPSGGLGLSEVSKGAIKAARRVEKLVPFWKLVPSQNRLLDRKADSAYFSSTERGEGVLFLPTGERAVLDFTNLEGSLIRQWIEADSGLFGPRESIVGGRVLSIEAPRSGGWLAVFYRDLSNHDE